MPNKNSIESEIANIDFSITVKHYDIPLQEFKITELRLVLKERARKEIKALIQREVKKGRVEELKKLWNKTQPDIMPLGTPPSDLNGQVILDRLEELEG